jgi:carbohydrate diacid regulator
VGVIGITGAYEQVIGYGQVVKKMTEILIREGNEQMKSGWTSVCAAVFWRTGVGRPACCSRRCWERGLALGVDITVPRG